MMPIIIKAMNTLAVIILLFVMCCLDSPIDITPLIIIMIACMVWLGIGVRYFEQ